jgi:hypothetical protein
MRFTLYNVLAALARRAGLPRIGKHYRLALEGVDAEGIELYDRDDE